MSSPVQLSDLDLATVANDADLALIRKSNTTDYKITVQALRSINIAGLPSLSSAAQPTDLMMISQGGVNSKIDFGSVGFTIGTRMWFYLGAVPVSPTYWQIVPNTGDSLLGVRGGSTYVTGGVQAGTWTQANHTLTIAEMPAHQHFIHKTKEPTGSSNNLGPARGKDPEDSSTIAFRFALSEPTGGSGPHNHGDTWRPMASVGIVCEKIL